MSARTAGAGQTLLAAVVVGFLGGTAAGVVRILPPWAGFMAGAGVAQGAALLLVLWSVHRALRVVAALTPVFTFGRAVACGVAASLSASVATGALLYALYRWLRPELLALRYAGYIQTLGASRRAPVEIAGELARLTAQRAQYLDPLLAAANSAALLALAGSVAATFLVWRRRTPRRRRSEAADAH